jgi:thiamine-phosphate pyrophosphorylase
VIRYAITEGSLWAGVEPADRQELLALAVRWAAEQVEYIQLREKDLPAAELEQLACAINGVLSASGEKTKLLINSHADVAIATGAAGVHLTAVPDGISPTQVRTLFAQAGRSAPVISVSCHTLDEVVRARQDQVDLILFGPIFGKSVAGAEVIPAAGLDALSAACEAAGEIPVLALGGVNGANTAECLTAGAKGIAGIRLFAGNI